MEANINFNLANTFFFFPFKLNIFLLKSWTVKDTEPTLLEKMQKENPRSSPGNWILDISKQKLKISHFLTPL